MIKIPFGRCIIVTTLDFVQVTERLESAIYDPNFSSGSNLNNIPKNQFYFGQISGFKFSATRIVGHKYFHLPAFLFPSIEGNIYGLHHGHEISLVFKLHNITFAMLLTWLGGLFAIIPSIFDNIFAVTKDYQFFLTTVAIVGIVYVVIMAYIYLDAWRGTRFFRTLFVKKFTGFVKKQVIKPPASYSVFQIQKLGTTPSSTDLLKKNLPSFPRHSDYPQIEE